MAKIRNRELGPYRQAWLTAHPDRDREWLLRMAREGFDVHHVDGDHTNNMPDNLVLIDHADHMRLHGQKPMRRSKPWGNEKLAGPPCWWDDRPTRHVRINKPCTPIWYAMRPDVDRKLLSEKETREQNAVTEYERNLRALVRRCEDMEFRCQTDTFFADLDREPPSWSVRDGR